MYGIQAFSMYLFIFIFGSTTTTNYINKRMCNEIEIFRFDETTKGSDDNNGVVRRAATIHNNNDVI